MTNYVGAHNANAATIEAAINTLQAQVAASISGALSLGEAFGAMFGPTLALIGANSYQPSGSGDTLTVAAGYAWLPYVPAVVRKSTSTAISFAGLPSATYYILIDQTGTPSRSDTSANAAWSVGWNGSAFGAITRLAAVAWGFETFDDAKNLAALAGLYQTLDELLEALGRAQTALISKTVTSADVTLTTSEAMEAIAIRTSGAMTAARALIVPALKKPYLILNDCTGGYALTVKTASGSGVALENGQRAIVYCDGTNLLEVLLGPASGGAPASALPVADTTALVKGSADGTKQVRLEVDGLTTSTTRVLTVPDADLTLGDNAYLLGAMYNGAPTASLVLLHHVYTRTVKFPSGLSGSQGAAGVAATAQTDFDLQKNGSSVGTLRFAAAAQSATFILASETSFGAGDVLKVVAPATPDATLADITFTLAGTR